MSLSATATYRPRVVTEAELAQGSGAAPASAGVRSTARAGGRTDRQLRPAYFRVGAVTRAMGSAYVEVEGVKAVCAVYGPTSDATSSFSDKGRFSCSFQFAPFAKEARRTRDDEQEEKAISATLEEALSGSIQLDKFPKSTLYAWVTLLEAGPGFLGPTISCVSLALADAGVELYDLVAACTVGVSARGAVMGPSRAEIAAPGYCGSMLLASMPSLRQVTFVEQAGALDHKVVEELVSLGCEGCLRLRDLMRAALVRATIAKEGGGGAGDGAGAVKSVK